MRTLYSILILSLVLFPSCRKGAGDFFSAVHIHYMDSLGNDLFTNGQNGYIKDSVNVYDFQNGMKKPLTIANQSAYFADWANSTVVINGIINTNVINHYTKNIIHLKMGVDDTLRVHLTRDAQMGSLYDTIWYNGVLKKDTFSIIK